MTATSVDAQVEREDREDLVAVDRVSLAVDREHAVAVAVEGDPEVEAAVVDDALQEREVGRAAADVDVRRRPGSAPTASPPLRAARRRVGAMPE